MQKLKQLMEAVLIIITPIPSTRHCPIQHPSSSAASLQENHLKSYAQKIQIHMASKKGLLRAYKHINVTDLWRGCIVLFEQGVTERLLFSLINISKPEDFFSVGGSKVKERLIHRHKLLSFTSNEKNTVPVNQKDRR